GAMQRTKYIYSDQQEHDPNAPPLYAFDSYQYPQTGFIMRPPNTGFLRGTVRNGTDLVCGASVTADASQIAYTSGAGTYSLLLSSGLHYITASYPGLNSVSREVNIMPGTITTADFNLESNAVEDITAPQVSTALKGIFPNPFNPSTTVSFSVYRDNTPITIELYDLKGRRVTTLVNALYSKGEQHFCFSANDEKGKDLASGIYFIQLSAPDYRKTVKVLLLK
ncbi:MAG TPA: T9SS type A sorting domain-containing protein, partial [Candidatus Cloacimonas sp.]|nr:T9SS type A sorting domain-containing protein [Candidatus Cloacimonas sp.]